MTVDTLVASYPRVALLKADVEGMEFDVLYGARKLLKRDASPWLYLESDGGDGAAKVAILWDSN